MSLKRLATGDIRFRPVEFVSIVSGLVDLASLQRLESLSLSETRVSDAALMHVNRLAQLQVLNLCGTEVTNEGVMQLIALRGLRCLQVSSTPVTNEGVESLQRLLPNCRIYK